MPTTQTQTTTPDPFDTEVGDTDQDNTLPGEDDNVEYDDIKVKGESVIFTYNEDDRDEETGQNGVEIDIDLAEFRVFEAMTAELVESEGGDGNDDIAVYGPDPEVKPKDDFMIESRAEEINTVSLGDSVRTGELDYVVVGGSVSDAVKGDENAHISGKLYEKNSSELTCSATKRETTIHGKMDVTSSYEDNIMLGGTMTETWTGASMIVAAMSDDLMAGIGARATMGLDLWLSMLNAMEERPASAAADGILLEAAATHFEREPATSVYAVGILSWSGTTITTTRSGFRQLMRVAIGVRNLLPGAAGGGSESPPPSPPAGPSMGTALLLAGIVGVGASLSRGIFRIGMTANRIADAARLSDGAADAARMAQAAADSLSLGEDVTALRHSADAAAQLEDLKAMDNAKMADDLSTQAAEFIARANDMEEADPGRAQALRKASEALIDAQSDVKLGKDPRRALIRQSEILENLGLADEAQKLRMHALAYEAMADKVRHIDAAMKEDLKSLGKSWSHDATEVRGDATGLAGSNPEKHEKMNEAATALDAAAKKVKNNQDPRLELLAKADELDEAGEAELAARLRRAADQYSQTVRNAVGGPVQPSMLLYDPTVEGYSAVGDNEVNGALDEPGYTQTSATGTTTSGVEAADNPPAVPNRGKTDVSKQAVDDIYSWRTQAGWWEMQATDNTLDAARRDVAGEMVVQTMVAHKAVREGADPRPGLITAASRLEGYGYVDEAMELREYANDFTRNVQKYTTENGGVAPRGILDKSLRDAEALGGAEAGLEEIKYSADMGEGAGETTSGVGSFTDAQSSYDEWIAHEQLRIDNGVGDSGHKMDAAKLPEGFDREGAISDIDSAIASIETEFATEVNQLVDQRIEFYETQIRVYQRRLDRATDPAEIAQYTKILDEKHGRLEGYKAAKEAAEAGENPYLAIRKHYAEYLSATGGVYNHQVTNAKANAMHATMREMKGWMGPNDLDWEAHKAQLDMIKIAKKEIEAGRDPAYAMDAVMQTLPEGSSARSGAQSAADNINSQWDVAWTGADVTRIDLDAIKGASGNRWKGRPAPLVPGAQVENIAGVSDEVVGIGPSHYDAGVGTTEEAIANHVYATLEPPLNWPADPDLIDARASVQLQSDEIIAAGDEIAAARAGAVDPPVTAGAEAIVTPLNKGDIAQGNGVQWPGPQALDGPDALTAGQTTQGKYRDVMLNTVDSINVDDGPVRAIADPPDSQAVVSAIPDVNMNPDGSYVQGKKKTRTANRWRKWFQGAGESDLSEESVKHLHDSLAQAGEQDWLDDMAIRTGQPPSWLSTRQHMRDELTRLRRESNWRGTIAYGDALKGMRDELVAKLPELTGLSEEAAQGAPDARKAYEALSRAASEAAESGDWARFKKITEFLEGFDTRSRMKLETVAKEVQSADEIADLRGTKMLNDEIDGQKLSTAIEENLGEAEQELAQSIERMRMGEATQEQVQEASSKAAYWQTAKDLVNKGEDPLVESSNTIAYLHATNQHDEATTYLRMQATIEAMMSNPDYHKQVDAFSYPTGAALRPDLASAPAEHSATYNKGVLNEIDMRQFISARASTDKATAAGMDAVSYEDAVSMIAREAGDADIVDAPMAKPVWEGDAPPGILKIGPEPKPIPGVEGTKWSDTFTDEDIEMVREIQLKRANRRWGQESAGYAVTPTRKKATKISFGEIETRVYASTDPSSAAGVPDMYHVRTSQFDSWTPTRQAGTRVASHAGDFPFSLRDKIVTTLMQGKAARAEDVANLHDEMLNMAKGASFRDGSYSTTASPKEWLKMRMAARDLRVSHPHLALGAAYQANLDPKTIGKLLDLLDAGH